MRGMRNIRSASSRGTRAGRASEPQDHQLFMQVTVLEMEKSRRLVERNAALLRVAEIDERLLDVESEKARLLARLSTEAWGGLPVSALAAERDPGDLKSNTLGSPASGLRIRY